MSVEWRLQDKSGSEILKPDAQSTYDSGHVITKNSNTKTKSLQGVSRAVMSLVASSG